MPYSPDKERLAWAAGFFDGEGSAHACYSYVRKSDGGTRAYPQVSISQSGDLGREPLDKFNAAVGGIGKIYGPYPPAKNQRKVRYMWEASGFEKTQAIMAMLWGHLGTEKRNKFNSVLRAAGGG